MEFKRKTEKRKTEKVLAKRLAQPVEVDGEVLAASGDWLVTNERGQRLICKADLFMREYEATSGPNPFNQLSL